MTKRPPVREDISVVMDGRTYSASYSVSADIVSVDAPYGSTKTQVGNLRAEVVAKMLLRRIILAARDRGELE